MREEVDLGVREPRFKHILVGASRKGDLMGGEECSICNSRHATRLSEAIKG
jgi:hypothetical protein